MSVYGACCVQCRRSVRTDAGGSGYSDEGEREASGDGRTRCKGAGDSLEAPPSQYWMLKELCCCLMEYCHPSSDDL